LSDKEERGQEEESDDGRQIRIRSEGDRKKKGRKKV
jgi:hypothetical protein